MSIQSPPTLLELAGRSLLSDKSRAVLDLEDLPIELFPPLFVEAFSRGHTEVLKKMVQAWPFTHLPLGALMRKPQVEMIRVAMDGLDMLLAQQDHPRRWKLQVLDLRDVPQNFWRMWSGAVVDACSPEDIKKNRTLKLGPAMAAKLPLKIFIDLCLTERPQDEFLTHFFLWVTQRRDRLHLCCNRLKIFGKPTSYTRKVLRLLQLDSVQRVEVHCTWAPSTLAACAPFMGQMRNLRKLLISQVLVPAHTSPEEQEWLLAQFTSKFLRMNCLQTFCVDAVLLLEGHLEQVLRHLKMPLKALAITNCRLSDSDWNYLSQCPNTSQLRHLDLKGIKLTNFSLEPLKILLETVAATLKSLDLEACEIMDSQLQAILPALSCCSQLRALCFFQNHISMLVFRDLLCHTARLNQLSLELYPAPLESYDAQGAIHPRRCSQLCAELTAILKDFRQPKTPQDEHQSQPTLLELTGSSLLSNKSRAILDLEDLPIELFLPLFEEAFIRGHTEVLKKMMQAWPFTHLPLGALMRKPQLDIIQVALDGLDILLAQQDSPR
ncbi:PRAME family member 20-like [Marmota flaviventris]|uniref:PRAME family member 20-like n=1 Tax=Marmota flaviventris TaxID=93162 RepID=UPI003A839E0C